MALRCSTRGPVSNSTEGPYEFENLLFAPTWPITFVEEFRTHLLRPLGFEGTSSKTQDGGTARARATSRPSWRIDVGSPLAFT